MPEVPMMGVREEHAKSGKEPHQCGTRKNQHPVAAQSFPPQPKPTSNRHRDKRKHAKVETNCKTLVHWAADLGIHSGAKKATLQEMGQEVLGSSLGAQAVNKRVHHKRNWVEAHHVDDPGSQLVAALPANAGAT